MQRYCVVLYAEMTVDLALRYAAQQACILLNPHYGLDLV